ncbi:Dyp-type peroxidase [Trebonia kvetii]|uniref:Dyp-type peroxidase n=1 Tax=Trebonia kvetii TaxID=2480626 RepID=UPI001FE888AB|nr:Dyp-type peroxidase [Trebonia kvetii]
MVSPLTQAAIFLVLTISPGGEDVVRDLIPDLSGLGRSVGFRIPEAELQVVVAIGSDAWDRLFDGPRPRELHRFRELEGPRHKAPATPGDLLFHIRATRMDLCFEYAAQVMKRLGGAVEVADEVQGFRYFDERDLIGFVDGTESPGGAAGLGAAITGADDDPDFAGGSYVIVQKYVHDMAGWNSISIEEQERVIGRTKLDDIELPDEIKPANSHVALNTITGPDGEERQIVRANMPFGNPGRGEFGTYYIAYAATPSVTEEMLTNMFIGKPPGNTDRILDFSTALTGCLFFAPCADFLDDPPGPPGADVAASAGGGSSTDDRAAGDGSLGIGSLRRGGGRSGPGQ